MFSEWCIQLTRFTGGEILEYKTKCSVCICSADRRMLSLQKKKVARFLYENQSRKEG